jgi:isocitrate dehydrogenase
MIIALNILIIVLAAGFKAMADKLTHHYNQSIFWKKPDMFWNPELSWRNKYVNGDPAQGLEKINVLGLKVPVFTPLTDAWHMANSAMICLLLLLPIVYIPQLPYGLDYIAAGVIYNTSFNLFYHKIFKRKK